MTEQPFVEGNHPNAYDARGNFQGNLPETAESPAQGPAAPAEANSQDRAPQVQTVVSQDAGYRAPGGLTREEIRAKMRAMAPYKSKRVPVEEWGTEVEIRSMALGDRNELMTRMIEDGGTVNIALLQPEIIVLCAYDLYGDRLYEVDDIAWLNTLPASVMDKVARPAMELNGFSDNEEKKAGEEAKKSSKTDISESAS